MEDRPDNPEAPGPAAGPMADVMDMRDATRMQCDLYRGWYAAVVASGLALNARGHLTRSALRQLQAQVDNPEHPSSGTSAVEDGNNLRLHFVCRLLERLGLLVCAGDGSRLVAAPRTEAERYFARPLTERLRLCTRLWLAGGWWPDRLDPHQKLPGLHAPAPPRVAIGRRQAVQALLDAAPERPLIVTAHPQPGVTRNAARARTAPHVAKSPGRRREPLRTPEDDSIHLALVGPLRWLGFVTASETAAVQVTLRPTRAIDALRSDGATDPTTLVERSGKVVVQSDFEVVAYPPVAPATLLTLDGCAERRGTGHALRYALTRATFAAARRAGWAPGAVSSRLEELAGAPLPQNVRVSLADWDRLADRLQVRAEIALLEVRDSQVLDKLTSDPAGCAWIVSRVSPVCALVHEANVAAVRDWLLRHGEMPAVVHAMRSSDRGPVSDP